MRTMAHPVETDQAARVVRRRAAVRAALAVLAAALLAGCSRDSAADPADDSSLAGKLCREVEALQDLGADVRTIEAVVDFYGGVAMERETDPVAFWDEVVARCGPVGREHGERTDEHVRAAVRAADDPEATLARLTCAAVRALHDVGADASRIIVVAIDDWYLSWDLDLDDDRYQELTMEGCGPVILAAGEVLDDREGVSREADRLAEQVTVAFDRCDDDGAAGAITNESPARLVGVGMLVILRGEGGAVAGEALWFGPGTGRPAIGPGATIAWSFDLEEHHVWNYGEVEGPVVGCVVEWIHVEDWE